MFARAPTFHVGAYFFGLRIICVAQLLLELRIFLERRHFNRILGWLLLAVQL